MMTRGVSALDCTFSPLQTFAVRRQLIRMRFMSGRCCCCLLILLVSLIGIYFTYYVNPGLKGLSSGGIVTLNPRKQGKNTEAPFRTEKLLSLDEGRKKIMEIAKLKSKLRASSLEKKPLEVPRDNLRRGYFKPADDDIKGGEVVDPALKTKLSQRRPGKKYFYLDLRGNIVTDEPEADAHDKQKPKQAPVERVKKLAPRDDPQVTYDQDQEGERKISKIDKSKRGKYSVEDENVAKQITQPLVRVQGYIGKPKAQEHVFRHQKKVTPRNSRFAEHDELPLLQDNRKISMTGINRMVHFTWRSNKLPEIANDWVKQWHTTNAILKLAFWDDASMNNLVERHFQDFVPAWNRYKFPIDRVRAFQILVLYKFGGIYSDIDVVPLEPLKGVINMYPCVLAQENPVACKFYSKRKTEKAPCVSMHIMACRANHPFLKKLIKKLKSTALSEDCSAKAAQCTSADILGEALMKYKLGHQSQGNLVQLVVPDYFSSTFDPAEKKNIQIACADDASLDNEQKRLCKILLEDGFKSKVPDSAYMLRKFLHTWGSRSNANQGVITDGSVSVYDSVVNMINGETLI